LLLLLEGSQLILISSQFCLSTSIFVSLLLEIFSDDVIQMTKRATREKSIGGRLFI